MHYAKVVFLSVILSITTLAITADFNFNPISGNAPLRVRFDASASTSTFGEPISFTWVFGDGYTGIGTVVEHTYDVEGNYNATLIVDNGTMTSSEIKLVSVLPGTSETVLEPNCWADSDRFGFVKLEAYAVYNQNGLYCYQTNVTATVDGIRYPLKGSMSCTYSAFVQLPQGTHTAKFNSITPVGSKSRTCLMSITQGSEPSLTVYSPKENTIYRTGDAIILEAIGILNNQNVVGRMYTELTAVGETNVLANVTLQENQYGIFTGSLKPNIAEGEYNLRFVLISGQFTVEKNVMIEFNNNASVKPPTGARLNILFPYTNQQFETNTSVPFEVEFLDSNSRVVSGAIVKAEVILNGNKTDEVRLDEKTYTYKTLYTFSGPGNYVLRFTANKSQFSDAAETTVSVGEPSEIGKALNFTVSIITPVSDTYPKNSQVIVRARVREGATAITNATVTLILSGNQYQMTHDRFGEYVYTTGPLDEGSFEARVIASYKNELAEDSVSFLVSEHMLDIRTVSPKDAEVFDNLEKGNSIPLTVDVLDETSNVVQGALVVAQITEPAGRLVEVQLFQDSESGLYKSVYFPNENGDHAIKISASKAGYVGKQVDMKFTIQFKNQGILGLKLDTMTLLTIVIVLAIIILVIGILRLVF